MGLSMDDLISTRQKVHIVKTIALQVAGNNQSDYKKV